MPGCLVISDDGERMELIVILHVMSSFLSLALSLSFCPCITRVCVVVIAMSLARSLAVRSRGASPSRCWNFFVLSCLCGSGKKNTTLHCQWLAARCPMHPSISPAHARSFLLTALAWLLPLPPLASTANPHCCFCLFSESYARRVDFPVYKGAPSQD
ncbi:hypothetical protein CGRA01v4_07517 [Colletotrichum graminicola]|nr:hypothetical protein CGRA01v4_07517 [Colletotrichum graminicola]